MKIKSLDSYYEHIAPRSRVVFDWDNTLKVTSADRKQIRSELTPEKLRALVRDKRCICYIISAIRPTRMNLDTLLFEIDKLQLKQFFCPECQQEGYVRETCGHNLLVTAVSRPYTYVSWGRVVICEYDKAEVFATLLNDELVSEKFDRGSSRHAGEKFHLDYATENEPNAPECYNSEKLDRQIYFFDDEEININNFSQIIKNSKCLLVKAPKF